MSNGLIRVYWVYTEDKTSDETIVSATSKTTKGVDFTMDPGYRFDSGYVDFEVMKAEDGDWRAVMSYTPPLSPRHTSKFILCNLKRWIRLGVYRRRNYTRKL